MTVIPSYRVVHADVCLYLLNDVVEGSLEFLVSRDQLPEISVSLQNRHYDLIHFIYCLIQTTLKTKQQHTIITIVECLYVSAAVPLFRIRFCLFVCLCVLRC